MATVRLADLVFGEPDVDEALVRWREAIERANNWAIGGAVEYNAGASGNSLFVRGGSRPIAAVVTTEIDAKPDADTLGEGVARLRTRSGADLTDGEEVTVFSNFSVAIPVGTEIVVLPDGEAHMLVGADCPT
jgi:hypothetical protein